MATYSSRQAAKRLGLLPATLSNYIVVGKIPAPKALTTGGITVHIWTDQDIERVSKLLPKIKNGRKTRYQKKQQSALSSQQSVKAKAKTKKNPKKK